MVRENRIKIENELEALFGCTMLGRFKTFGIKTEEDAQRVVEICNSIEGMTPKEVRVTIGHSLTSGQVCYETGGEIWVEYKGGVYHKIYISL